MNETSLVIATTVASTGLTVLNDLLYGDRSMRPIIGGFVVGTGLLFVALFNPPIAAALALLILVTSILVNGVSVLEKVMSYGK